MGRAYMGREREERGVMEGILEGLLKLGAI